MRLHLIISCIHPALVTVNHAKTFVCDDKKINITLTVDKHFYLTTSTISDNLTKYNDFTAKFTLKNNILVPNQLSNIINHHDNTYEIVLLNHARTTQTLSTPESPQRLILIQDSHLKIIDKSKIIYSKTLQNDYPDARLESVKDILILSSPAQSHSNICLIHGAKAIEYAHADYITGDDLKVVTHLNTYARHIRVDIYDDTLHLKESYTARKSAKRFTNPHIVPYAFLQNVLVGDYKEATTYLDEKLKNSLKKEHLRLFFGDFIQLSVPKDSSSPDTVTLVYRDSPHYYTTKNFTFVVQDGLITNIDDK